MDQGVLGRAEGGEVLGAGGVVRGGLGISNEELDAMVSILEPLPILLGSAEPGLAARKRFLARGTAGGTRALMRALAGVGLFAQRGGGVGGRFSGIPRPGGGPAPLITGGDLGGGGELAGGGGQRGV